MGVGVLRFKVGTVQLESLGRVEYRVGVAAWHC